MAVQTQFAFDFGEQPQQKLPEQKVVVKKEKPVIVPEVVSVVVKTKSTRGRKSIEEMNAGIDLVDVPEDEILFQKMYIKLKKTWHVFGSLPII